MKSIIYYNDSNTGWFYIYFHPGCMVPIGEHMITKYGTAAESYGARKVFKTTTYTGIYTPDFGIKFERTNAEQHDYRIMLWQKEVTCQIIDNAANAFNDPILKKGQIVYLKDYLYGRIMSRTLDINPSGIPICTLTIMARNY